MSLLLKRLPVLLAALHAAATVVIFRGAYLHPELQGMNPVLLFLLDIPASYLIEALAQIAMLATSAFHLKKNSYYVDSGIDGGMYLMFGSAWAYFIGWAFRWVVYTGFAHGKEMQE